MADKPMDVYLNDHLAGAMLGSALAKQIQALNQGSALGTHMESLAALIEEDRQTLIGLMERMDTSKNPVKQAATWVAEKVSRAKLRGPLSGGPEVGTFMALETLSLGVQGKVSLWKALNEVAEHYPSLASLDLDELIERAQAQHDALEHERIAASRRAFNNANAS